MFLSALLVDVADWRWLFVLPAALVIAALATTLKALPNSHEHSSHAFDTVGALISVVGLALMAGFASVDGGYPSILPGILAMGIGMGLAMTAHPRGHGQARANGRLRGKQPNCLSQHGKRSTADDDPDDDASLADLAEEYSVGRSTIHRIISGTAPRA